MNLRQLDRRYLGRESEAEDIQVAKPEMAKTTSPKSPIAAIRMASWSRHRRTRSRCFRRSRSTDAPRRQDSTFSRNRCA